MIRLAREINDHKTEYVIEKVLAAAKGKNDVTVACLGLAFKPNVDDLRESPALHVVDALAKSNKIKVLAVEPNINEVPDNLRKLGVELTDALTAISRAEIVVTLVAHQQFSFIDAAKLTNKTIIDSCGLWRQL
jgi:UDP-N-acetyl-D-mannosaminuronic acid dehydrogenase